MTPTLIDEPLPLPPAVPLALPEVVVVDPPAEVVDEDDEPDELQAVADRPITATTQAS